MHETRKGEMAAVSELPFGQYYGGVDTTPLFVMLAGAYARRTGDLAFIDGIWTRVAGGHRMDRGQRAAPRTALSAMRAARPPALPTRAGRTATTPSSTPMAVRRSARSRWSRCRAMPSPRCRGMARLAARRGDHDGAARVERVGRGSALRAVESSFWMDELQFYASPSTAMASLAECARRTPVTCCSPACPRPSAARAVARQLAVRRVRLRLGRAHAGGQHGPLQSDVLPQRLGLAARHRPLRRGHGALRRARWRCPAAREHVRGGRQLRHAAAGAVLRLQPRRRRAADRLSGGLPAASLGGGIGVHAAAESASGFTWTDTNTRWRSTGRNCRRGSRRSSSLIWLSGRIGSMSSSVVSTAAWSPLPNNVRAKRGLGSIFAISPAHCAGWLAAESPNAVAKAMFCVIPGCEYARGIR